MNFPLEIFFRRKTVRFSPGAPLFHDTRNRTNFSCVLLAMAISVSLRQFFSTHLALWFFRRTEKVTEQPLYFSSACLDIRFFSFHTESTIKLCTTSSADITTDRYLHTHPQHIDEAGDVLDAFSFSHGLLLVLVCSSLLCDDDWGRC